MNTTPETRDTRRNLITEFVDDEPVKTHVGDPNGSLRRAFLIQKVEWLIDEYDLPFPDLDLLPELVDLGALAFAKSA